MVGVVHYSIVLLCRSRSASGNLYIYCDRVPQVWDLYVRVGAGSSGQHSACLAYVPRPGDVRRPERTCADERHASLR